MNKNEVNWSANSTDVLDLHVDLLNQFLGLEFMDSVANMEYF